MKVSIVSYSKTGNNEALAKSLATELNAEHIRITEPKSRTMGKIVFDVLFKRTPKINASATIAGNADLVLFVGPVWMGQVATPFRSFFDRFKVSPARYAYISISGGADGENTGLGAELTARTGRQPAVVIDLHLADFLPPEPKPTRKDTLPYRLNAREVKSLTATVVKQVTELKVR